MLINKALAIDEKVHGEDRPDTAMRYNNLGIVAQEIEDSNDFARMHEKALSIRGKLLRTNRLDTAQSYNNLGLEMHSKGDHTKCYKKPLRCISKLSIAATLSLLQHAISNNIGAILQDMDENRTMRHSNTSEEHLQFTVKHLTRGRVMITLEWSSTTKMILKERC